MEVDPVSQEQELQDVSNQNVEAPAGSNASAEANTQPPPIEITPKPNLPADEKALIKSFEEEASKKGLKLGDTYYIVATRWYKAWKEYVVWDPYYRTSISSPPPGPIDNDVLVENGSQPGDEKIRKTCMENYDYVIVSPKTWANWHAWYGGGPALPRFVIASGWSNQNYVIEVRPLNLKVLKSSDMKNPIYVNISKSTTVFQFKKDMCAKLNVPEDNVRVWDYHSDNRYKLLEDPNQKLDQAQIIDGQPMLLEEKGEDGKFPEIAKATRSFNSGYSNYNSYAQPTEPGATGLMNLGNTCFMNSSLQCLSQTPPLIDYLLSDRYKAEINLDNPLGSKGELAEQYASLVKELWAGTHSAVAPRDFKWKLERFAPQFAGYQQHDSQELLAFLLDGLHEDLNRIKKKPYTENPEVGDRSQEEVAREAWASHRARNDSFIVDWFQGQLRSTLVCPTCARVSITFDPFMYLSLPLPMNNTRHIIVNVFFMDPLKKPVQYGVEVSMMATIGELLAQLGKVTNVPAKNLVLTEVYNSRLFKQFSEKENVDIIQDRDVICAYEVLTSENEDEQANIRYYPVLLRTEEVVTQQYSASGSYTRRNLFGYPFVLSVPHAGQVTYKQLYALIYNRLQRFLNLPANRVVFYEDEVEEGGSSTTGESPAGEEEPEKADDNNGDNTENNANDEEATQLMDDEDLDSDDIDSDASDLDSDEEAELLRLRAQKKQQKLLQLKQQRLKPQSNGRVPIFVLQSSDSYGSGDSVSFHNSSQALNLVDRTPIAVTWSMHSQYHYYNKEAENEFEKHASSRKQHHNEETSVRLDKCIDLFTMTEKLGPEDPWYCSRCKEFQQATKKFDIWKAPPILVVHLKRFSYRNKYWREKLETYVDYPIHDLDLSAYVQGPQEVPPIYELYAVSNHYGSLGGGHYTAYGKNTKNHKWYKFDDSSVGEIDESKSQTSSAYVLFYRRKDTFTPEELAAATTGAAAAAATTTSTTTTTTSTSNNNNDVDSSDDDTNTANSSSSGRAGSSSAAAEGEPSEDAEMRD